MHCAAEYGFFRYGTDYALTCSPDDTAFLKRLRQISPDEDYPAQFAVAYLTPDMGQSLTALTDRLRSASFDDLFSPYPDEEQISLSEYLSDFTNHFLGVWNSGRASGYATRTFNGGSVSLETAIRDWLQIYCGMSGHDLGQHRTIPVRRLRSRNFRQIVQKFAGILCVFPRIFGQSDGIFSKQDVCYELCGVALVLEYFSKV